MIILKIIAMMFLVVALFFILFLIWGLTFESLGIIDKLIDTKLQEAYEDKTAEFEEFIGSVLLKVKKYIRSKIPDKFKKQEEV